jgi:DNA-binding response OmpR family regulator
MPTKSCVLPAEDNRDLLDLYSFVLKSAGFEVRQAQARHPRDRRDDAGADGPGAD